MAREDRVRGSLSWCEEGAIVCVGRVEERAREAAAHARELIQEVGR
mgnify:CR=1 FL=1